MTDTAQDIIGAALAEPEQVNVSALMAKLIAANYRDYAATTNAFVENLRGVIADREAELAAIRCRINELFASDYMPTESAIIQAVFHPSKALMARLREVNEP